MSDYAIVESGGQQFRVEKGTELVVDRVPEDEGAKVLLRPVAYLGDSDLVAAGGDLEKVKVEATVAEHIRGPKLTVFKYKAKKGYRRRAGHRQDQTRLEVTEVKLLTRKPAAKKPAAAKPAAEKPAAKKPAAKKPATKKPAAKKTATKKPAQKKESD
jgi:large subunit ribosomal protein L21